MPERLPPVLQRMLAMWNGETVDPAGVYASRCVQDGESTFEPADVAADVRALRAGIPDLHFEVDDWFAAGTRYVLRMRAGGTHSGLLTTPSG